MQRIANPLMMVQLRLWSVPLSLGPCFGFLVFSNLTRVKNHQREDVMAKGIVLPSIKNTPVEMEQEGEWKKATK